MPVQLEALHNSVVSLWTASVKSQLPLWLDLAQQSQSIHTSHHPVLEVENELQQVGTPTRDIHFISRIF